jgi:hypothetical protein
LTLLLIYMLFNCETTFLHIVVCFSAAGAVCRDIRRGMSRDYRFGPTAGVVAILGWRIFIGYPCHVYNPVDVACLDPGVRDIRILAREPGRNGSGLSAKPRQTIRRGRTRGNIGPPL